MPVKKTVKKAEVELSPEVSEEVVEVEETVNEVEVNTEVADVSNAPKEKNVRVKIKKDLTFNFGSERYNMKSGQCYNVPVAVKLHLNKLDVLSPL